MALLSTLVSAIAEVEGMEEVQVGWVARHLRESGLISQAGRGRGAAHMLPRDAVNLLIAVNTTSKAKDATGIIPVYRQLVGHDALGLEDGIDADNPFEQALLGGLPFGEAFEILLKAFIPGADKSFDPEQYANVEISFYRPEPSVVVDVGDYSNPDDPEQYMHTIFGENVLRSENKDVPDRKDVTTISSRTLQAVGRVLAN